ncbi:Histone-lysine N-methyltransferase SETMAR [Melipona quadrifasciata]|uniref:Histone-lysine N-methyltransferase SETMAR n=1 Tax=Melipona quadrifasciata TaxID=166423 RepID=A0A0M9ACZ7_9HYME|nr:Histone-lysine N-methyltransferase SETMAR [Melipona quadrifasciata]
MESQKMHVMLHCFKKGNSAKDTADEIFTVYGSGTTTIRTVGNWFKKFRAGNFELKDEDRSGRPATIDTDIIKTVLTGNPRYSVREIVNATNIPKTTVHKHRYEVWVPHLLTETGLMNRVSTCDLLLQRHERDPFLKYELLPQDDTINADKYCNQLDQLAEKRPELAIRRGVVFHHDNARPHVALAVRQKFLQFDWDVLPYPPYSPDLAPSDYYLFLSLKNSLRGKSFKSISEIKTHLDEYFQPVDHDNARPHVALAVRQTLLLFDWDVLPHPPYSPDLAPSDYYLFLSLKNSLRGKSFKSISEIKTHLDEYFTSKLKQFWKEGTMRLPERWKKVIEQNGSYIT